MTKVLIPGLDRHFCFHLFVSTVGTTHLLSIGYYLVIPHEVDGVLEGDHSSVVPREECEDIPPFSLCICDGMHN